MITETKIYLLEEVAAKPQELDLAQFAFLSQIDELIARPVERTWRQVWDRKDKELIEGRKQGIK